MHPTFTPDQVKGALMASAKKTPNAAPGSVGLGELDAFAASKLANPPNPNAALDRFVGPDPTGGNVPVFDSVGWSDAAKADVSWDSVAWGDVAWGDVSWQDVAWDDVSWEDISWGDVAWSDVSWQDVSWEDAAEGDAASDASAYALDPSDVADLQADPDLAVAADLLPASLGN
jgi:hypothetical protein